MMSVSFGDRPASTIATAALRKTTKMGQDIYPATVKTVLRNTYMDDILDSVDSIEKAKYITTNIEELIKKGAFQTKGWIMSGDLTEPSDASMSAQLTVNGEKVLGVGWDPDDFKMKINSSPKIKKIRTGLDLKIDQIPTGVPNV